MLDLFKNLMLVNFCCSVFLVFPRKFTFFYKNTWVLLWKLTIINAKKY